MRVKKERERRKGKEATNNRKYSYLKLILAAEVILLHCCSTCNIAKLNYHDKERRSGTDTILFYQRTRRWYCVLQALKILVCTLRITNLLAGTTCVLGTCIYRVHK